MSLDAHFSQLARRIEPAAIRKVMALASAPDVIAFTGGKPAPNLFPLEAIRQKTSTVLDEHGPESLQYASTDGYLPLRQWVAGRLPGDIKAENLMIISGSQQAIDLVGRVFIDPGDKVVVAAPTYTAALTTLRVYGPEFLEVECDGDGMLPESLEAALQQGVKLIYAVPNFMNPTGVDMSRERRQQLADLARQYDVPVLEDDPYGDLRFEGETPPNVYELAPDRTIYAGTFSKILMPGLRLGWLTGPPVAMNKLLYAKQAGDLQAATYSQHLVYELTRDGFMDAQIAHIREYYQQQRDWMMAAIRRYFPAEAKVREPAGGLFIWVELPEHINATELIHEAINRKVAYVPGSPFFASDRGHNTLRLSFSLNDQASIEEGIRRLGGLFTEALAGSLLDEA